MKLLPALLCACLALAGCGRRVPNATPDGAVRELVERMRRVKGDPADAKAAFEMLSKHSQENLVQRAKRYSDASGKAIAPEAMLAPSRFLLRFEPQRYVAQVSGAYAHVEILGLQADQRAKVPAIFEDGVWKVELVFPLLPPVQMRPGSEQP